MAMYSPWQRDFAEHLIAVSPPITATPRMRHYFGRDGYRQRYGVAMASTSVRSMRILRPARSPPAWVDIWPSNIGTRRWAADGREPLAGVARETTGNLYGTAAYGGIGIVLFSVE